MVESGKLLALVTNSDLRIYDIAAGKSVSELAIPSGAMGKSYFIYLKEPAFSPDGKELAGLICSNRATPSRSAWKWATPGLRTRRASPHNCKSC